ncbi:hypothetical protein [Flavobacterium sp. UBA7680]|uniref:hypothetical protein n=1 Tax=Flavobacterium sp. UBA7680 TaxID=1946559 RepID=UPI0025C05392|nr:hypothetical protein [Flavobacterium sp. UBA7680]
MDFTPKDLGETFPAADIGNLKNPWNQQKDASIIIGNFNITPLNVSQNNENLTEAIKKESQDSCI